MANFNLENFLSNFSFFILFVSMLFYWIQVSFNLYNKKIGTFGMILANICLFLLLILRWKESGHFPLSNLYESFLFLSWNLTLIHFVLEKYSPFSLISKQGLTTNKLLGAITSPIVLFTDAFANFSLPAEMRAPSALVPALQSNWLMMHVTVMILSYSALICGSLLSIAFLILTYNEETKFKSQQTFLKSENLTNSTVVETENKNSSLIDGNTYALNFVNLSSNEMLFENPPILKKKLKLAEDLDHLSYRILGIGFPLLTIGILSGAVWANEAWGSYWSWDPKETWALLTWFVFAIYLHTRITKGWQGKKPAIIASLGFFIVWICFLGVNLLGEGLHSYGFFKING
jgi:cytochrome c-type biogenesis protein CcsB